MHSRTWHMVSDNAKPLATYLLRSTRPVSNIILHGISGSFLHPFVLVVVLHHYRLRVLLLVAILEAEGVVVRHGRRFDSRQGLPLA